MKIGLIGYGKMGREVESLALERGHHIMARLTSTSMDFSLLEGADVCIDFSGPESTLTHIEQVGALNKPLVLGTTGWEKDLPRVVEQVKQRGSALLFAPNFSMGIYIFRAILKKAISCFEPLDPHYLAAGMEIHHESKADHLSGTAKLLIKELGTIPFSSLRSGYHPGTHQVFFDSVEDTIELTHRARSRRGFAQGALEGAEWLIGKKGFFTFDDFMQEKTACHSKVLSQP